jgi:hypothetical protein
MRKILFFLLLFFVVKNGSILCQFSGGSGTQTSPYLISTINDINELRDSVQSELEPFSGASLSYN